MKKLWEKILAWLSAKWNALKAWFIAKRLPWLKKNWMIIVNYLVIALAYNNIFGKDGVVFAQFLLGIWIFTSIAYAGYKLFVKK